VSAGTAFPDSNAVAVFNSAGNRIASIMLPYQPCALAYSAVTRLLYVVCYEGPRSSKLHVLNPQYAEVANYKIRCADRNISIGVRKDGVVYLAMKTDGTMLRLNPAMRFGQ
jgi:hypothetical protein